METFLWLEADALRRLSVALPRRTDAAKKRKLATPSANSAAQERFVCHESVNADALAALDTARLPVAEATKLQAYTQRLGQSGCVAVEYTRQPGVGRWMAVGPSLQKLARNVRGALAHGVYVDIDMVNAHPSILLSIAETHAWDCSRLRRYVDERDAVLAEIGLPRDEAKTRIVALINGAHGAQLAEQSEFLHRFAIELRLLRANIFKRYAAFREDDTSATSRVALLLQTREAEAMMSAVQLMTERGWQVGVLMHDGFMVRCRTDAQVDAETLRCLSAHIAERHALRVRFQVKAHETSLLGRRE